MKHKTLFLVFITLFLSNIFAAMIFEDNFNDGNITGWTGYGTSPSYWQANSSMLKYNGGSYVGSIAFIGMDNITTPENFTLEADLKISPANNTLGHVGFFWGYKDTNNFNTAYLRTHSDHVTHWSYVSGSQSTESYLNIPGASNATWYHMKISVDYTARTMTTEFGGYTTTFTGTTFDSINPNTGGKIGVLTWGEVGYFDNVVFSDNTVPEASTLTSIALTILLCLVKKFKKN